MLYFDAPSHTYWHSADGVQWRQLPSVTQVLGGGPPRRAPALTRGTLVHAACAALHLGGDSTVPEDWQGYVDAYLRACLDRPVEWVYVEQVLAQPALGVAGTVDRFGLVAGAYTVVDLKTAATPGRPVARHGWQLAGYAVLINPQTPDAYRREVWALHPDGTYTVQPHTSADDLTWFLQRAATARGEGLTWHPGV